MAPLNYPKIPSIPRRLFLKTATLASAAAAVSWRDLSAAATAPKIAIGIDNFALRDFGWKAPQLIDYAASIKCDALLISDLDSFDSLDDAALQQVRGQAEKAGIALYAGGWSICPTSKSFRNNRGSAEEYLRLGIRVAKALGSPVFRVVLGNMEDRKTEGGIKARIADTLAVLKACRADALAAGVKIAIENHAGDMHSWELRGLIDAAGPDFTGANIDSGNAAWTLEDPLDVLEILGPVTICSSLRDDMIWETPDGASVQWTAVGDGLIDWKSFTARWAALCPDVPMMIETISGGPRNFPYKQPDFWKNYDLRPEKFAKFEALAKRGKPLPPFKAPDGPDRKKANQDFQKADIEKSIAYLRTNLGLGLRM